MRHLEHGDSFPLKAIEEPEGISKRFQGAGKTAQQRSVIDRQDLLDDIGMIFQGTAIKPSVCSDMCHIIGKAVGIVFHPDHFGMGSQIEIGEQIGTHWLPSGSADGVCSGSRRSSHDQNST